MEEIVDLENCCCDDCVLRRTEEEQAEQLEGAGLLSLDNFTL